MTTYFSHINKKLQVWLSGVFLLGHVCLYADVYMKKFSNMMIYRLYTGIGFVHFLYLSNSDMFIIQKGADQLWPVKDNIC